MITMLRSHAARLATLGAACGLLVACSSKESGGDVSRELAPNAVDRGRYLVTIGGCNDCHTPKLMTTGGPVLDSTRLLAGHPAGTRVPPFPVGAFGPGGWAVVATADLTAWAGPWGMSFAPNLTPDPTGMRNWTSEQFIQAMRTGKHMGTGRAILPPMPWQNAGALTDDDLRAVFAYLQSLKPVANPIPLPVPPASGIHAE